MQIRAAGDYRQRFVRGIAAYIRAERDWMARLGQKFQICPVRVVYRQNHSKAAAGRGKSRNIKDVPQVVRACDVYRRRLRPPQLIFQLLRRNRAAVVRAFLRENPVNINIKQRGGVDKRLVGVSSRKNSRRRAALRRILRNQIQHSLYTERRAARGIKRFRAEYTACV